MEKLIPWLLLAVVLMRQPEATRRHEKKGVATRRIHATPGRLRLRLPLGALPDASALGRLATQPGIRELRHNRHTGSLLIRHDPVLLSRESVLEQLAAMTGAMHHADASRTDGTRFVARVPPAMGGRAGELFGRALFETFARQTIERSVFTLVTTALKGG